MTINQAEETICRWWKHGNSGEIDWYTIAHWCFGAHIAMRDTELSELSDVFFEADIQAACRAAEKEAN